MLAARWPADRMPAATTVKTSPFGGAPVEAAAEIWSTSRLPIHVMAGGTSAASHEIAQTRTNALGEAPHVRRSDAATFDTKPRTCASGFCSLTSHPCGESVVDALCLRKAARRFSGA